MGKISDTPTLYLYELTTKVNQLNCEKITILFSINNVISIFKAILIQKYIFQIIVRLATIADSRIEGWVFLQSGFGDLSIVYSLGQVLAKS